MEELTVTHFLRSRGSVVARAVSARHNKQTGQPQEPPQGPAQEPAQEPAQQPGIHAPIPATASAVSGLHSSSLLRSVRGSYIAFVGVRPCQHPATVLKKSRGVCG